MAKKHYRAFKKKIETTSPKGTFIPNTQKSDLLLLSCVFIVLTFVVGSLIGYVFGKKG